MGWGSRGSGGPAERLAAPQARTRRSSAGPPDPRRAGGLRLTIEDAWFRKASPCSGSQRQLFRFRGLLGTLTARELKARYRGSVLGFLWSLANPLLLLTVYTFVFSVVFQPRVAGADPYALFVVSGLFPWIWLSTSMLEGSMSLIANGGLIRKAVFPAELLPMVAVLSNLVHLLLALPVILVALLASWLLAARRRRRRRPAPACRNPPPPAHDRGSRGRPVGAHGPLQGRPRPPRQPSDPALLPDSGALPPGVDPAHPAGLVDRAAEPVHPVHPGLPGGAVLRAQPRPRSSGPRWPWSAFAAWLLGTWMFERLRETLVEAV